ncbi:MAG: methyltransferase domain-containing protein [Planctomycetota bacterium]
MIRRNVFFEHPEPEPDARAEIEAAVLEVLEGSVLLERSTSFQILSESRGGESHLTIVARLDDLVMRRSAGGSDPVGAATHAARALKAAVTRNESFVRTYRGPTPVLELKMVSRFLDESGCRDHLVPKATEAHARARLDLSGNLGTCFFNIDTGRPSVMLHHGLGRFEILEPGQGLTVGAGRETDLSEIPSGLGSPSSQRQCSEPVRVSSSRRYQRIRPLLRCPSCRGPLSDESTAISCSACARSYRIVDGVPILTINPDHDYRSSKANESAHPHGQQVLQLIERHREGLVLDCGAGSATASFENVVQLDILKYPLVDVVASGEHLPFADEVFDAVVSEAVLEHVPDPFAYVREMERVLRPGGEVRVDVAFLQPYHAYPHHYFNMTLSGLELVMRKFEKIESGCGPHQQPALVLNQVLRGFLDGLADPADQERLRQMTVDEILRTIEEDREMGPFLKLDREAVFKLASGFYFFGRKRQDG